MLTKPRKGLYSSRMNEEVVNYYNGNGRDDAYD
jgi:hypothetical protein